MRFKFILLLSLILTLLAPNSYSAEIDCWSAEIIGAIPTDGEITLNLKYSCGSGYSPISISFDDGDMNQSPATFSPDGDLTYPIKVFPSLISFDISYLKAGIYFPKVILVGSDFSKKTQTLNSIVITAKPVESKKSTFVFSPFRACFSTKISGSYCFTPTQNWVYISTQKTIGPYAFEELVGKKWVKSPGITDISKYEWSPSLNKPPDYLVQIDFPKRTPGVYTFKLSWKKSGKYGAGSENIVLKVTAN